jgi:hypothetical protein
MTAAKVWKPPHLRERSRPSSSLTQENAKAFDANGFLRNETNYQGRSELHGSEVMTDIVTPGFRSRSSKGEIINTAYSRYGASSITPKGNWNIVSNTAPPGANRIEYSGSDAFFFAQSLYALPDWNYAVKDTFGDLPNSKSTTALIDLATISARAGVIKADTLALVTLAELHKTIAMVSQSAKSLSNGLKLLIQGKPIKAVLAVLGYAGPIRHSSKRMAAAKTAASKWLEIRYGWLPLIYDVQGTLQALKAVAKPRYTARGFANDSATSTSTGSLTQFSGMTHLFSLQQTLEKRVRAYVLYEVDQEALIPQKLGLLQVPATAWELVPFSFVVDWFVDIGEWLDALTPRVGVNILAEGYTVSTNRTRIRTITGSSLSLGVLSCSLPGQSDLHTLWTKSRTPRLPSAPLPRVNMKINPKRATDAIALLVQQFRSLR